MCQGYTIILVIESQIPRMEQKQGHVLTAYLTAALPGVLSARGINVTKKGVLNFVRDHKKENSSSRLSGGGENYHR